MARFNPFRRVVNAIRRVVAPSPPPRREQEPPQRPPTPTGPSRDPYRQQWRRNVTARRADYRKNLEVFHSMIDPIEDDEAERLELWESYIRNMVNGEGQF